MAPLGLMSRGEKAQIMEIRSKKENSYGNGKDHTCQAEDMGLRIGKEIEILNNEGRGPILLKVEESRIAIGRSMAMKIMVKSSG